MSPPASVHPGVALSALVLEDLPQIGPLGLDHDHDHDHEEYCLLSDRWISLAARLVSLVLWIPGWLSRFLLSMVSEWNFVSLPCETFPGHHRCDGKSSYPGPFALLSLWKGAVAVDVAAGTSGRDDDRGLQ